MKIILDNPNSFFQARQYLTQLLNDGEFSKVLEIKRPKVNRSLNQNRLLWMWLTCLEVDSETGYTKDEFYQYFLEKFAMRMVVKDESILITSSQMNTAQMTDFLERIRLFCYHEFQISLPLPDDKNFEEFYKRYH